MAHFHAKKRSGLTSRNRAARRRFGAARRDRRGVLILVVLSLLVLFVILAVMYVAVASRARMTSKAFATYDTAGDTPQDLVNNLMMDLLRGTLNPRSSLYCNSLLEDVYGLPLLKGTAASPTSTAGGAFVEFTGAARAGSLLPLNDNPQFYAGCVLTFTSGPASGQSTRVVSYNYNSGTGTFRVLPLQSEGGPPAAAAYIGEFVINGRAFGGLGVGYNPTTGLLDALDSHNEHLLALLPNSSPYETVDPTGIGGANESYDAADFQNPFLALYNMASGNPTSSAQIKPSFHDPALISYWQAALASAGADATEQAEVMRKVIFRPNATDHPIFAAMTNPNIDLLNGPWDIDNDGDLIPDSVWIDPGYPVQTTRDGRIYKPLVAYLVLDMDGRLNINAHDTLEQPDITPLTAPMSSALAGSPGTVTLPRGYGAGPAEIRLNSVLNAAELSQIKIGGSGFLGRYGEGPTGKPGRSGVDPYTQSTMYNYPDTYGPGIFSGYMSPPDLRGRMAMGLDHLGQPLYQKADWTNEKLDHPYEINLGRYAARGLPMASSTTGPFDSPFTAEEFERILRPFDSDTGTLAPRLATMLGSSSMLKRNLITIDSWHIPAPSLTIPSSIRAALPSPATLAVQGRAQNIAELIRARMQGSPTFDKYSSMISFDLLRGEGMNINRPFGNGADDDGNGIVDGPAESLTGGQMANMGTGSVEIDPNNGFAENAHGTQARETLARHLYVLMLLFNPDAFSFPTSETLTPDLQRKLTCRRLAQWAVNVVDFMDADNIMTPFVYDENPFTDQGWRAGSVETYNPTNTTQGLVWGCESPVLVLTETFASHDRRVRDTAWDNNTQSKRDEDGDGMTKPDAPGQEDATLDQPQIPRGLTLFELAAVYNQNLPVQSTDLFTYDGTKWVLDLGKLAPDNRPVWRLAITEVHPGTASVFTYANAHRDSVSFQPSDPLLSVASNFSLLANPTAPGDFKIERIVWLCNQAPAATHPEAPNTYYGTGANPVLNAGEFALVCPGGTGAGARTSATLLGIPIGAQSNTTAPTKSGLPSSQQIVLTPTVAINNGAEAYPAVDTNIKRPIAIPVASGNVTGWTAGTDRVGLTISEPIFSAAAYYPKATDLNTTTGLTEAYGDLTETDAAKYFRDLPLDSEPGTPLEANAMLASRTNLDCRTVFLQRLADPTKPWHAQTNPYLTVDWMPIDLTVFNGEDRWESANSLPEDQWDPDDSPTARLPTLFASRQR
ncbi:MAG: hypothetical protein SGJ20_17770, partial [Planctomycetota bacterium]|nr:hypothetical protein [Planctomycetota bacterium]